jgi:hypothetical protein
VRGGPSTTGVFGVDASEDVSDFIGGGGVTLGTLAMWISLYISQHKLKVLSFSHFFFFFT